MKNVLFVLGSMALLIGCGSIGKGKLPEIEILLGDEKFFQLGKTNYGDDSFENCFLVNSVLDEDSECDWHYRSFCKEKYYWINDLYYYSVFEKDDEIVLGVTFFIKEDYYDYFLNQSWRAVVDEEVKPINIKSDNKDFFDLFVVEKTKLEKNIDGLYKISFFINTNPFFQKDLCL